MSRTRSQSGPTQRAPVLVSFSYGGSNQTLGPLITDAMSETMTDVVTKNYRSRIRAGEIIINPCSYRKTVTSSVGTGSGTFQDGAVYQYSLSGPLTNFRIQTENFPNLYPSDTVDLSSLVDGAKLEALAAINKPALETGEDMLEIKETLDLLRAPLKGILTNVSRLKKAMKKKGQFKEKGLTVLDALSSEWLEYRMAFSPLIRSIHDILSEISNKTSMPPSIRRAHGRRNASSDGEKLSTFTPGADIYVFRASRTRLSSAHAVILYKLASPVYGNAWRYGLRARDFPKTFWAVVPLSFMVDRVFDVSKMISGLTNLADPNVIILGASVTVKTNVVRSVQMVSHTVPGKGSASGETIFNSEFIMSRDLYSPGINDTVPRISPGGLVDSSEKIGDLAALVFQALRSKL